MIARRGHEKIQKKPKSEEPQTAPVIDHPLTHQTTNHAGKTTLKTLQEREADWK